jgi:hypothetical protein
METKCVSLFRRLSNSESYVKFCPSMLPPSVTVKKILKVVEFLCPTTVILHGSNVSHKKFSTKKCSDIDIVCVSAKAAFFPLEQLHQKVKENIKKEGIEIDLDPSIVTPSAILSIIEGGSSLSKSLSHGFSILYCEEENENR